MSANWTEEVPHDQGKPVIFNSRTSTTVYPKASNQFILCAICAHTVALHFADLQNNFFLIFKKVLQIGSRKKGSNFKIPFKGY